MKENKLHCLCKKLSPHKYLEIQCGKFEGHRNIFCFELEWTTKADHAGFRWHNEILGWHFIVNIYDHRHWDYRFNRWQGYEKQGAGEELGI